MSIVPISNKPRHCRYCSRLHTNTTYVHYCSTTCKEAAAHKRYSQSVAADIENSVSLKCFVCGEMFSAVTFLAHYSTHTQKGPFDPLDFLKQ